MGERGQTVPLLALVVVAAGGLLVGLGRLAVVGVDVARAQSAADAVALAGAADGRGAADAVARANGATVESYVVDGREVEVTVSVADGAGRASARAARVDGGGGGDGRFARDRGTTPRCWSPRGRADECSSRPPYAPSRGAGRRDRSGGR